MNPKTKRVLMIAGILLGVGLCLAVVGYGLGGRYSFSIDQNGFTLYDRQPGGLTQSVPLEAFDTLDVQTRNLDIEWVASDHYEAVFTHTMERDALDIRQEGGRVTIRSPKPTFGLTFFWYFPQDRLTLYYPADKPLASFTLQHSNGSATLSAISAGTLDLQVDNGSLTLQQGAADVAKLDVSNGYTRLSDVRAQSLNLHNDNGRVEVGGLTGGPAQMTVSNGALTLSDASLERLTLSADNGDSNLQGLTVPQGLEAHARNGRMALQGDVQGKLNLQVSNGNLDVSLAGERTAYDLNLQVDNGGLTVDGTRIEGSLQEARGQNNQVVGDVDNGSLKIAFGS